MQWTPPQRARQPRSPPPQLPWGSHLRHSQPVWLVVQEELRAALARIGGPGTSAEGTPASSSSASPPGEGSFWFSAGVCGCESLALNPGAVSPGERALPLATGVHDAWVADCHPLTSGMLGRQAFLSCFPSCCPGSAPGSLCHR